MLVFGERGKLEYLEKNLLEQSREPTNSTHLECRVQEIEPGPHWWKASALTTAPSLLSCVISKVDYLPSVIRCELRGIASSGMACGNEGTSSVLWSPLPLLLILLYHRQKNLFVMKCLLCNFEASVLSLSREVKYCMIPFFVLILLVAYFYVLFIQRIQLKTVSNFGNI